MQTNNWTIPHRAPALPAGGALRPAFSAAELKKLDEAGPALDRLWKACTDTDPAFIEHRLGELKRAALADPDNRTFDAEIARIAAAPRELRELHHARALDAFSRADEALRPLAKKSLTALREHFHRALATFNATIAQAGEILPGVSINGVISAAEASVARADHCIDLAAEHLAQGDRRCEPHAVLVSLALIDMPSAHARMNWG